jgi:ATP-binding cassette subfamily B protein
VVLGEGGVVEEGRHAALLAAGGPYSRLHAAQFGRGASGAGVLAAE